MSRMRKLISGDHRGSTAKGLSAIYNRNMRVGLLPKDGNELNTCSLKDVPQDAVFKGTGIRFRKDFFGMNVYPRRIPVFVTT